MFGINLFNLWPAHWGLRGKMRQRAKIEYNYSALEHDRLRKEKLIKLDLCGSEEGLAKLALSLEFGDITQREYKEGVIILTYQKGSFEAKTAENELLLEYGDITQLDFEKAKATLADEPWVHGELHGDPDEGFYFEMDWNTLFLDYLSTLGFSGSSDEDIVDQWVTRLYTNEFMLGEWDALKPEIEAGVKVGKIKRDDGKTEHT